MTALRAFARRTLSFALAVMAGLGAIESRLAQTPETMEKGRFTVAFSGEMPGTGFHDGKLIAYDGEILQRIADALALKVQPALMEWSGTIASVQSKRVDIMADTAAMERVDLCVFPTNAIVAIPLSEVDEEQTPLSLLGRFVNLLNPCSVAVPAGLSPQGLPVSVQIIGRPHAEGLVLRAAHAYQQVSDWHRMTPPERHGSG